MSPISVGAAVDGEAVGGEVAVGEVAVGVVGVEVRVLVGARLGALVPLVHEQDEVGQYGGLWLQLLLHQLSVPALAPIQVHLSAAVDKLGRSATISKACNNSFILSDQCDARLGSSAGSDSQNRASGRPRYPYNLRTDGRTPEPQADVRTDGRLLIQARFLRLKCVPGAQ